MSNNVLVGVAGSGKSAYLLNIVEQRLKDGLRWDQVMFSSFSRAACSEAASRAARITGVDADRLQKDGWFRTVHSSSFRLLAIDSKLLIDHDAESGRKFVEETLGAARGGPNGTLADKIDKTLEKWDSCRNRLNRFRPNLSDLPNVRPVGPVTDSHRPVPPGHDSVNEKARFLRGNEPLSSSYYGTDFENEIQNYSCGTFRLDGEAFSSGSLYRTQEKIRPGGSVTGLAVTDRLAGMLSDDESRIIRKYEQAKRYSGRYDFTDMLLRYAGVEVDDELMFRECYPLGSVPSEIAIAIFDEYQDSSELLHRVAQRLAFSAGEVWMAGDVAQSVYGFASSSHRILRREEMEAENAGKRVLLNRSWRNPTDVVRWAEEILEEDPEYVSRGTWTEVQGGSVGLVKQYEFMSGLAEFAGSDTLILARTWFGLGGVKKRLEELNIPWTSCSEKEHSHWDSPVKIAIVITMRDLIEGRMISEQDWRRLTENFNMKSEGLQLFEKGEKARWKKLECSGECVKTIEQLREWGATSEFTQFVQKEMWRKNQYLLLDVAIEKFGVELVRSPKIRLGTCHSAKGLEANYVFCLSQSSELANQSSAEESIFLKYVTVTRTKRHYRCVVDEVARSKGKPLFLACPKGNMEWKSMPEVENGTGGSVAVEDPEILQNEGLDIRGEVRRGANDEGRYPRSSSQRQGEVRGHRTESKEGDSVGDAAVSGTEDIEEWWNL